MTRKTAGTLAAGIAIAIVLLAVMLLAGGRGGRYAEREATADSPNVRGALEILRAVAEDPQSAEAHLADDASRPARNAVAAAAGRLSGADRIDYRAASWYGQHLRVSVLGRRPDGRRAEEHFFFVRDGDRLRITGVDR